MKKKILAFLICIVVVSIPIIIWIPTLFKETRTEKTKMPWIYVHANEIRNDQTHTKIIFHGANSIGVVELNDYYDHWNEEYFQKMKDWNINIVRFPIHYPSFKYYEDREPGSFLELLDRGIEWAARRGIYSIIDFHSCGWPLTGEYFGGGFDSNWGRNIYDFTPQELRDFWRTISTYFANDSRIAFYDLFNEPAKEDINTPSAIGDNVTLNAWLEWKDFSEELIDIIREKDPDRAVLVGGLQFSYYLNHVLNYPIEREDVAYSVHVYNTTNWLYTWDDAFGQVSQYFAILIGEVGFEEEDDESTFADPFLDYLDQKEIGWLAWNFGPEWTPKLFSDWNFNPTYAGTYFYNRFLSYIV